MDANRFDRLEARVEKLDDKIDQVKLDLTELKVDVKNYAKEVKYHVEGDEKIISEIIPFIHSFNSFLNNDMPQIKQVILNEEARKIAQKESLIKKTNWKMNSSILSAIAGIVYTLYKMQIIKF
jgi:hypothetical protein